jgi:uncharacterized CHY-type Zn-finger protein
MMSQKPASHRHRKVTTHAIRQRSGVPYEVERIVCATCRQLLEERPLRRTAA